jgi:hypothetical protein
MLGQQLDGALGQRVALFAPQLPADIGVHVLGVEADGVQHTDRLGENGLTDAVARHAHYGVLGHGYLSYILRVCPALTLLSLVAGSMLAC